MSARPVSSKPASVPALPASGLVGLLSAMGLSAVQVGPEVVALQTTVKRARA